MKICMLEAQGYTHIECLCRRCGRCVWMPFDFIRPRRPRLDLGAMTIDDLGRKMVCCECGSRDVSYREARQSDSTGFASGFSYPKG